MKCKYPVIRFIVVVFLFLRFSNVLPQSVDFPIDHWAYNFIDRMITKGLVEGFSNRALPLSREEIANIIIKIDENLNSGRNTISNSEKQLLAQLRGEFNDELKGLYSENDIQNRERHFLKWEESNNCIYTDIYFKQEMNFLTKSSENSSHTTLGGILRGNLKNSMGFYIFVHNTLHRGTEVNQSRFNPSEGQPQNVVGKNVYSDDAAAYFTWKLPWFDLKIGRDQEKFGPGYRGSLMLSQQNPLFDMIKLETKYNRFMFTYIHGNLSSSMGRKYFVTHRLEFKLSPKLFISGSESVIYGNRGFELQYLNPLMPYHVAEHHLGDKDNNNIGLDITTLPLKNQKFYFELFIDDYTLEKNPFKYIGNKFAFMFGWHWVEPFGLKNWDLHAEYTRIEPFVYTHYDSINEYINYDRYIGHWLGPNSDDYFVELNYIPIANLKFSLAFDKIRHGSNESSFIPYQRNKVPKEFLNGIVEQKNVFYFQVYYQFYQDAFLSLEALHANINNLENVQGEDFNNDQITLKIWVNY